MKRHKIKTSLLRNRELQFCTTVNFEKEHFRNEETEGVMTDNVMDFHD